MPFFKLSLSFILISFTFFGCSSKIKPSAEEEHNTTVWLLSKYGESDSELAQELKERLLARLVAGAKIAFPDFHNPIRLFFLRSATPSAFSQCDGSIFLTEGMITSVPSLAELSAIIAHEIAHVFREDACSAVSDEDGNVTYSTGTEIEADKIASKILLASFIDPRYLESAIQAQYRLFSGSEAEKESVSKRLERLSKAMESIPKVKTKFSEERLFNKLRGAERKAY